MYKKIKNIAQKNNEHYNKFKSKRKQNIKCRGCGIY